MEEFVVVDEVGKVSLKHKKKHEKTSVSVKDTPKFKSWFCKVKKANSPCLP